MGAAFPDGANFNRVLNGSPYRPYSSEAKHITCPELNEEATQAAATWVGMTTPFRLAAALVNRPCPFCIRE